MKKLKLRKNPYPGKLIIFEGLDGAGKTTLLEQASAYLTKCNIPHIKLKMPSNFIKKHPIFDAYDNSQNPTIRNTVNLEHLTIFVSGDRLLTLSTEIIPALKQGITVLCDRYCFTGYMHCTTTIIRNISKEFLKPNLVVMPTATLATLKQRVQAREEEKNNYYNNDLVKQNALKFKKLSKLHKFIKINTEQEQAIINQTLHTALNTLFNLN